MMTQEEYMKVHELRAAGWTIVQIAEHVGYHPATVSEWLRNGGPPARRATPAEELVVDERWRVRIGQLLERNAALQGSSVMRVITAEGFDGSYQTLTRYLRDVRGPTRGNSAATPDVTMRIETEVVRRSVEFEGWSSVPGAAVRQARSVEFRFRNGRTTTDEIITHRDVDVEVVARVRAGRSG